MPRRALTATALALLAATLVACAAPAPEKSPSSTGPDDNLRHFAPEGLQIGSAVAGGGHHLEQDYPDPFTGDDEYRDVLAAEFSSLTPENQLKWEFVHPAADRYDFAAADAIVDFAEQNGQVVRGHTLLWHSQNPAWLEQGDFTAKQLRDILHDHITTVVSRYAGRIAQWDVANEIFDDSGAPRLEDNIWLRELGPDIVADAFRWAHEADPDAVLFLNDYGAEGIGPKSDAYYDLAQQLLADEVPLGGFAVQGHLSLDYPFPADAADNLQRFADLGLQTAVTELDVRMTLDGEPSEDQLTQQADYFTRLLGACLATDGCGSVTLWGIPDRYSWVPLFFPAEGAATPLWDDYSRKVAYCALQEKLAQESGLLDDPAFTGRGCAA